MCHISSICTTYSSRAHRANPPGMRSGSPIQGPEGTKTGHQLSIPLDFRLLERFLQLPVGARLKIPGKPARDSQKALLFFVVMVAQVESAVWGGLA